MPVIGLAAIPPALVAFGDATAFVGSAFVAAWGVNEVVNMMLEGESKANGDRETDVKADACSTYQPSDDEELEERQKEQEI